eukprot:GEMP01052942.1.p1 GENE.GEMP01052942.1~~GEMP01052942.1.p1  ORF type:complete len:294 (+),score=61.57 GEMP01052942.1:34-882(+)
MLALDLPCDTVAWAPEGTGGCCGLYKHIPETDTRDGRLIFFDDQLQQTKALTIPGVYDLTWEQQRLVLVAGADGNAYGIVNTEKNAVLRLTDCLLTHVAQDGCRAAFTDQRGMLHVVDIGTFEVISTFRVHDMETWTCNWHGDVICTGADDASLKVWDVRQARTVWSGTGHDAGVTATMWRGEQLYSGSYDEKIRIFDWRGTSKPLLQSRRLGDGAYRLCDCPNGILVANMREGFKVLSPDTLDVQSTFDATEEVLGYGVAYKDGVALVGSFEEPFIARWEL